MRTEDLKISTKTQDPALAMPETNISRPDVSKLLFGRAWELSVSNPRSGGTQKWTYNDLHMIFNIEKTCESFANKARIEVFNMDLAQHTQNWKGMEVELKVGYGKTLRRLFWGNVAYVQQARRGSDIVTTFDLGDGERSVYTAYLVQPYPALTPVKKVMIDAFVAMELTPNFAEDVVLDKTYNTGMTVSGSCKKVIDDICKTEGLHGRFSSVRPILPIGASPTENRLLPKSPRTRA